MHYRICPKGIFTQDPTTCKSEVIISVVHQDLTNILTLLAVKPLEVEVERDLV